MRASALDINFNSSMSMFFFRNENTYLTKVTPDQLILLALNAQMSCTSNVR